MRADDEKIYNYDVDNLRLFEEQICPQDIKSDENNHVTQEELLHQDGFFAMLQICAKLKAYVSRLSIMNLASMKGNNFENADK